VPQYVRTPPGTTVNDFYVPSVTLFDAAVHYDFAALGEQFKGYNCK
jgi:iron complex outermembrane receptor protein